MVSTVIPVWYMAHPIINGLGIFNAIVLTILALEVLAQLFDWK